MRELLVSQIRSENLQLKQLLLSEVAPVFSAAGIRSKLRGKGKAQRNSEKFRDS